MSEVGRRAIAWRAMASVRALVLWLLSALIRGYQGIVSPWLPPSCRFTPSCSSYALAALERHGPLRGLVRTLWRLARCHPGCRGGYDPP